jgi:hypothetical protein
VRFTWDERKRLRNLEVHGLDFADAKRVFHGPTVTIEDDRYEYAEQRFLTIGLLAEIAVSIVHTESASRIHVISFRKATRHEQKIFFESV